MAAISNGAVCPPRRFLLKREQAVRRSDRVWLAPSCSLLHSPIDASAETALDPAARSWLAFACEKIEDLRVLPDAPDGDAAALAAIALSSEVLRARANSALTVNPAVRERLQ